MCLGSQYLRLQHSAAQHVDVGSLPKHCLISYPAHFLAHGEVRYPPRKYRAFICNKGWAMHVWIIGGESQPRAGKSKVARKNENKGS